MATPKQIKAAKLITENLGKANPDTLGDILLAAGYSKSTSETPANVTESKSWDDLMEEYLPDTLIAETHQELLKATRVEHMTFPLYRDPDADTPLEGDIPEELLEPQAQGGALLRRHKNVDQSALSDDDIRNMIAETGCKVRRIVHGEQARHVYYFAPDSVARKGAIELAYKIKGRITNKVKLDGDLRVNPFKDLETDELRKLANDKQD